MPEEVFINKTYVCIVFGKDDLSAIVGKSGGVIDVYPANRRCDIKVVEGEVDIDSCRQVTYIPSTITQSNTIYDIIIDNINDTTITAISKAIYHTVPNSLEDAIWGLLIWLDEYVEYNYSKALLKSAHILSPIEFLTVKSGVCTDYALFSATALLGAGLDEVYILSMETERGPHAATAVKVGSHLIVVDQHPPPLDWEDYIRYMNVTIEEPIQIYEVWLKDRELQIRSYFTVNITAPDSWPDDVVTNKLVEDVVHMVADALGSDYSPRCREMALMKYSWRWRVLQYYTPLFHDQWVRYLSENLTKSFSYKPNCIYGEALYPDTIILYYH